MIDSLLLGDAVETMKRFPDNAFDAIVTDPPYGIGFMGRNWDTFDPDYIERHVEARRRKTPIPGRGTEGEQAAWVAGVYDRSLQGNQRFQAWCHAWALEALRVLKPGGHMVVFGGTRTHHRLWCAVEDAGFEIRDCLMWLYGSGFPKSHDVSAAIDRQLLKKGPRGHAIATAGTIQVSTGKPLPPGESLPPYEPESGAARQWQGWGTALKPAWEPILLARKPLEGTVAHNVQKWGTGALNIDATRIATDDSFELGKPSWGGPHKKLGFDGPTVERKPPNNSGRWPANLVLDEESARMLGEKSRFFYCAKANRKERGDTNKHPTVKPLALIHYLCCLITPPGGTILDPFVGSGTTCIAAQIGGFQCLGIDNNVDYLSIAVGRLCAASLEV